MSNKLTVLVITYNHVKYIKRCLDSILSQKTKFEFNIYILDDCSTDGSSDIVKEYVKKYPNKIIPFIRSHNLGLVENIYQGIKTVKTEYYATVESDDYWCDNDKLQQQIDMLEKHPDCSFCGHDTSYKDYSTGKTFNMFSKNSYNVREKYKFPNHFDSREFVKVHPSSRVYRTACIDFSKLKHKSPYSASKASSDFLIRTYHQTYGMNVTTSNCSNNYGPKQHSEKLIPTIIEKAISGENIPIYGDGNNIRDWLYVIDHCKAIDLIYHKGVAGHTYNVGGRNEKTNLEVVATILGLLDVVSPRSDGASYKEQITFVKDRVGHDRRYGIDATKVEQDLGWAAEENFATGIEKTVNWYLKCITKSLSLA